MCSRWLIAVWVVLSVLLSAGFARAADTPAEETVATTIYLMQQSLRPQRNGLDRAVLRALRHLADPELAPFYRFLITTDRPALQVHGILGLAECDAQHHLDLEHLAKVKDPALQTAMVSAALDADLIDSAIAKQIVAWPDLDLSAKVIVAARLVKDKQFTDRALLIKAASDADLATPDKLPLAAMATLLLVQIEDPEAEGLVRKLRESAALKDDARVVLFETAIRYEFDHVGPWAMQTARDRGVDTQVGLVALRAALRFAHPDAPAFWRQQFQAATDIPQRNRLALLALNVAPWSQPTLYDPLLASDDALLKRIGRAGAAVAAKTAIVPAITDLIQAHHPLANSWCLAYARLYATSADAEPILMAVIRSVNPNDSNKADLLDGVVTASQFLFERSPKPAVELLRPTLADPKTDPLVVQGILLGLLRCKGSEAYSVVAGLPPFSSPDSDGLALLLLAKTGQTMNAQQMHDLSLLARGGGNLPDVLRMQAAWLCVKRLGQSATVLNHVTEKYP